MTASVVLCCSSVKSQCIDILFSYYNLVLLLTVTCYGVESDGMEMTFCKSDVDSLCRQ